MLKLKLSQIVAAESPLAYLQQQQGTIPMPFTIGYKLKRILKAVAPEIEEYKALYVEMLKKYGTPVTKDEEGKEIENPTSYKFDTPEIAEKFSKEFSTLMNLEIELPNVLTFKLSDFEGSDISLSLEQQFQLEPFILEEEESVVRKPIADMLKSVDSKESTINEVEPVADIQLLETKSEE